jgi:hypothetical protein
MNPIDDEDEAAEMEELEDDAPTHRYKRELM